MHPHRLKFKNSRGKNIVGFLFPASSEKLVIMSPGSCDDKSSQGRFDFCAHALNAAGISALTLDFSGSGESDDDTLTVEKEVDDLKAAISFAQAHHYTHIGLFGHSLGGLVSLMAYSPPIQTIVMMSGLTGPITLDWETLLTPEQKQERATTGTVTLSKLHNMSRERIVLDKAFFEEFDKINQQSLLENVHCPVFMIHGDADDQEQRYHKISQTGLPYLSSEARIEVIPGADHGFWGHMDKVADLATAWFTRYLR